MTRRWTHVPVANDVSFTPPTDCCFDAENMEDAIYQLLHIGSLVAIKIDGGGVIGFCELVKYSAADINVGYLYKVVL